jgi:ubiquinone biosynthesis protein UbiJ
MSKFEGPVTPHNERFSEILGGLFSELLRVGGMSMLAIKAHERIREVGRKTAAVIEFHAERKAVEVARKLQTAVSEAFTQMEKETADLRRRLEALEKSNEDPS